MVGIINHIVSPTIVIQLVVAQYKCLSRKLMYSWKTVLGTIGLLVALDLVSIHY